MNEELLEWKNSIIEVIRELQYEYSVNKGLFLTEGDLECHLYKRLTENQNFNKYIETESGDWKTGFIHSQVTWFKKEYDSGFRVDLTVLNPKNLKINKFEMVEKYPNKGFFHDGMVVALELKFIRDYQKSEIKSKAIEDFTKIINNLKISKEFLINTERYRNVTKSEVLFIPLVVCKTKRIYEIARNQILSYLDEIECPKNVIPTIFYYNAITIIDSL